MRRLDIIRKVMTGGKPQALAPTLRLLATIADVTRRGIYKQIATAENYIDSTYSGTRCFIFNTAGSGTSSFTVRTGNCSTGSAATFSVDISVPSAATVNIEGLLQNLVGTSARVGLTFYDGSEGGNVARPIAISTLTNVINDVKIQIKRKYPLGRDIMDSNRVFCSSGDSLEGGPCPRYSVGQYTTTTDNKDPYNYSTTSPARYPTCAKSFVLLLQTESHVMMTIYLQV